MRIILVLILIALITIISIYFTLKKKVSDFSKQIFGTKNILEGIKSEPNEIVSEPKSVASMESLILPSLVKDFPNLDINDMRKNVEKQIILCLQSIEDKKLSSLELVSDKVKTWINSKIADLKENETVNYDSIKIHRTVLNKYVKSSGMCTIVFQTSLEYLYRKNNESYKKIQDRFNTEFVYIYDDSKTTKTQNAIALNCPNCGAPIKNLGVKVCEYCGTGVIDLVKKTWILNDISQF